MPDEVPDSSSGRSWLDRISQFFGNEPTNREDLVELMRSARDREVVDSDTLGIVEGALEMADMKVRDVMIPRTQMVVIRSSSEPRLPQARVSASSTSAPNSVWRLVQLSARQ